MGSSRQLQSPSRGSHQQIGSLHTRPYPTASYAQDDSLPLYTTPSGDHSPRTQYNVSPASRQGTPGAFPSGTSHLFVQLEQPDTRNRPPPATSVRAPDNDNGSSSTRRKLVTQASPAVGKSKRVRTGCLTCRERHLKCDERVPDCNNCRKSNRECKRGIRLNFMDAHVHDSPCLPKTAEWSGMSLPFPFASFLTCSNLSLF